MSIKKTVGGPARFGRPCYDCKSSLVCHTVFGRMRRSMNDGDVKKETSLKCLPIVGRKEQKNKQNRYSPNKLVYGQFDKRSTKNPSFKTIILFGLFFVNTCYLIIDKKKTPSRE